MVNEKRRQNDIAKEVIKEALKEWMDERYAATKQMVGGAIIKCFCVFGFCLFVKLLVYFNITSFHTFMETTAQYVSDQGITAK